MTGESLLMANPLARALTVGGVPHLPMEVTEPCVRSCVDTAENRFVKYFVGLALDLVEQAALLPAGYAATIGSSVTVADEDIPIVTWEALLASYRKVRTGDDYFMGMLDLALRNWKNLCSQPLAYGVNAEAKVQGREILRRFGSDPSLSVMGRTGGIDGPVLSADLASGNWKTQLYEVSSATNPINSNWFYVDEFVRLTAAAESGSPVTGGTEVPQAPRPQGPKRWRMTGEEILAGLGNSTVHIVGRVGGLHGAKLAEDLALGRWSKWLYEVPSHPEPLNANWFTMEEFAAFVSRDSGFDFPGAPRRPRRPTD